MGDWQDLPTLEVEAVAELARLPQWVAWRSVERDGKLTKVPLDPRTLRQASVTDPATWGSFDAAYQAAQNDVTVEGVGFVLTARDPYLCIDLDRSHDPETMEIDGWAAEIVNRFGSYTEISPSGRGLHVWCRGRITHERRRVGRIEVYPDKRFITVTGCVPGDKPRVIADIGSTADDLLTEHLAATPERPAPAGGSVTLRQLHEELEPHVDANAQPPLEKLDALFLNVPVVKETWLHKRTDVKDWTASEYDLSLANFFISARWPWVDIMHALIAHRRLHGADLKLDRTPTCDIYARTIARALRNRREEEAKEAITAEALEGREDEEKRQIILESLSEICGIRITDIIKYAGDPPSYRIVTERGHVTGDISLIMSPATFRKSMAMAAGIVVERGTQKEWDQRAQAMLDACRTEYIGDEATEEGQARAWVRQYLDQREAPGTADINEYLRSEAPFVSRGSVYIVGNDFNLFLSRELGVKVTPKRLGIMFRQAGIEPVPFNFTKEDGKRSSKSCWRLPEEWT